MQVVVMKLYLFSMCVCAHMRGVCYKVLHVCTLLWFPDLTTSEKISECLELVPPLLVHIPNILVSLGKDGVLSCSATGTNYFHYPPAASHLLPVSMASVTGAGDR